MMYSIGADMAKCDFYAGVCDEKGKALAKARRFMCNAQGFSAFMAWVDELVGPQAEIAVCVEACGNLHLNLIMWLVEHRPSVAVYVVNALVAKRFGGPTLRRNHTDPADAVHLGRLLASCRDKLHRFALDGVQRQLQRLVLERGQILGQLTSETNRLHAALTLNFPEYSSVMSRVDQALSLELLERFATARQMAGCTPEQLAEIRPPYKGGHKLGLKRAQQLLQLAQSSVGCAQSESDGHAVVRLVQRLKLLYSQQGALEKEIAQLLSSEQVSDLESQVQAIESLPGLGPVTAVAISARCGVLAGFASADAFTAFVGTCPGRYQSGQTRNTAMLTPYGPCKLRAQLFMAVRSAKRGFVPVAFLYQMFRQKGLKHRQALCACLNRLMHWCWGVVQSKQPFDPKRIYRNLLMHHGGVFERFCAEKGIDLKAMLKTEQQTA